MRTIMHLLATLSVC